MLTLAEFDYLALTEVDCFATDCAHCLWLAEFDYFAANDAQQKVQQQQQGQQQGLKPHQGQVPELGQGLVQHPLMLAIGGGRGKVQRQLQGQSEGPVCWRLKGLGQVRVLVQEQVHELPEASDGH